MQNQDSFLSLQLEIGKLRVMMDFLDDTITALDLEHTPEEMERAVCATAIAHELTQRVSALAQEVDEERAAMMKRGRNFS